MFPNNPAQPAQSHAHTRASAFGTPPQPPRAPSPPIARLPAAAASTSIGSNRSDSANNNPAVAPGGTLPPRFHFDLSLDEPAHPAVAVPGTPVPAAPKVKFADGKLDCTLIIKPKRVSPPDQTALTSKVGLTVISPTGYSKHLFKNGEAVSAVIADADVSANPESSTPEGLNKQMVEVMSAALWVRANSGGKTVLHVDSNNIHHVAAIQAFAQAMGTKLNLPSTVRLSANALALTQKPEFAAIREQARILAESVCDKLMVKPALIAGSAASPAASVPLAGSELVQKIRGVDQVYASTQARSAAAAQNPAAAPSTDSAAASAAAAPGMSLNRT